MSAPTPARLIRLSTSTPTPSPPPPTITTATSPAPTSTPASPPATATPAGCTTNTPIRDTHHPGSLSDRGPTGAQTEQATPPAGPLQPPSDAAAANASIIGGNPRLQQAPGMDRPGNRNRPGRAAVPAPRRLPARTAF